MLAAALSFAYSGRKWKMWAVNCARNKEAYRRLAEQQIVLQEWF